MIGATWKKILMGLLFSLGASFAPLGVPSELFFLAVILAFALVIFTYYANAWKKGHSGIVILGSQSKLFSADTFKLRFDEPQRSMAIFGITFLAGLFLGLAAAISWANAP